MLLTLIIVGLTCVGMITLVLIKPCIRISKFTIGSYWPVALVGAILVFCLNLVNPSEYVKALTSDAAINPIKILTLFISLSLMSVYLDEVGFFKWLAVKSLVHAGHSRYKLFIILYITVSVLTVFTSNDIIILTFTPFICYFAKNAKINPLPFLIAEFVAANSWSMLFIIGNPTNIYLATNGGLDFIGYFKVMALPTIIGGLVSFGILNLLFARGLKKPLDNDVAEALSQNETLPDRGMAIIGLLHLALCTVLLIVSSYIGLEMWLITLSFAVSLFLVSSLYSLIKKRKTAVWKSSLKRAPWEMIPFILSMFALVLALENNGIVELIGGFLGESYDVFTYGFSSFFMSNIINNITMSVLYSPIIDTVSLPFRSQALFAAIVGSNLGAILTPIGALAGIMWQGLLKTYGYEIKFGKFLEYGALISLPTITAVCACLYFLL